MKQVGNAKVQNTKGAEKEQVGLAYTALKMSKEGNDITAQELEDELNKTLGDEKTKVTGSNTLKIEFSDTKNVYTISNDGSVEEYKKAEVTPVYAFLCDTNNDGTGETLVLSSTDSIDGYTIINNYGDNEAYQTNEDNVEESWGSYYYYPIWKNETALITNVIIYDKIVPTTTERWFENCSNLTNIENISYLDTSNVTTMVCMFYKCSNLTTLNLSSFDTSNVTNMASMFSDCSKLTDLNLSDFDISNSTNLTSIFNNCSSLTSLDLSSFDTSSITYMGSMFKGCSSLTKLDLSNFDTKKVTDMVYMFSDCSNLVDLNLSNFNTINVINMMGMFINCRQLKTIIVGTEWTTSNVNVSFSRDMFTNCTSLVGGEGTTYNSNYTDKTYAHIDGGTENPGYLTASSR